MRVLEERPRATAALAGAIVVLVVAAMLAGGAIAGGDIPTPHASSAGVSSELTRARRAAVTAQRQLASTRVDLRKTQQKAQAATSLARRWEKRAKRAERRNTSRDRRRGRQRSHR